MVTEKHIFTNWFSLFNKTVIAHLSFMVRQARSPLLLLVELGGATISEGRNTESLAVFFSFSIVLFAVFGFCALQIIRVVGLSSHHSGL